MSTFLVDYSTSPPEEEENSPPPPPSSSSSSKEAPPPKGSKSKAPPPKESSPPPPPKSASPPPPKAEAGSPPPPGQPAIPATLSPPPPTAVPGLIPPPAKEAPRAPARDNPSPKSPAERSKAPPEHKGSNSDDVRVVISVGVVAGIILLLSLICCIWCCFKKKKKKPEQWTHAQMQQFYGGPPNWYAHQGMDKGHKGPPPPPPGFMGPPGGGWANSGEMSSNFSDPHHAPNPASPNLALGFNKSTFTYDELATATNGFSQANLLGQGGFGYVHKGVLASGKVVAVKSLKTGSGQGEREFQAEVDIISRVHHRHLVSLVGYCIAGGQRMLVYEYVPNKTLEYHLHVAEGASLDWSSRLMIAIGSAKGLAYLHEDCHPRIIHRDIKAANILLDNNFEAMVADFGLAKLSADNFTHVSTRVMGTFGYLAPEYASSGKLTEKSDVFSFGVMLLELITGRRPVDTTNKYMDDSLVDWARPLMTTALANDEYDELVDPRLHREYNPNEMKRMIACASAGIRHSAKRRPKMSQIVRALEGDVSLDDLNDVGKVTHQGSNSTMSSEYNTREYNEDLIKFRKMALETQGEDSGYTSTYGLNPSSSSDASTREWK